jgi:two-component system, NarL family, invasion response regulator UvrY
MKTILVADDHEIVRCGIRMIINSLPQKYHVIEATTCTQVIHALSGQQVQHAILDMNLADGNIFSAVQTTAYYHQTNVLVYSMNDEKIYAPRLMQKGARGFVSKQAKIEELEIAIKCVLNGEIYLSADLKETLFNTNKTNRLENPIDALSDRELEVVEYIAVGMGAKEIARRMNIDITTVSTYRRRAFDKLNVQNMIELKDKLLLYKTQG